MRRTLQGTAALAERWMLAPGTGAALVGKGSGHRAALGNQRDWRLRAHATSGTSIVPPSWTAGALGARGASTAADAMLREEAPAHRPLPVELPTVYQQFIHKSRYARWLDSEQRRETWSETVGRYFDFMQRHLQRTCGYELTPQTRRELEGAVLRLEVMPSMRALMTAGPALERDNVCAYNCSYLPVSSPRAFDECLYILMSGTGVGFSVEKAQTEQLPVVAKPHANIAAPPVLVVEDSKRGWAEGLRALVTALYAGQTPQWDLSQLRPAGARLVTMGGRASGPDPLNDLFHFTVATFHRAAGRQLTPMECHDLMCKVGEVVVAGGVRRSALISLSDLDDDELRVAKSGPWWEHNGQRALSNNSVAYTQRPAMGVFMAEWLALYESKSGERGIFNRAAAEAQVVKLGRREPGHQWGCNPCSEIILRPFQFCNLSEVVVRADDTVDDMAAKVKAAAMLGTFQATLVDFQYLSPIWKENTEEERLLGVSLTGIMDNRILAGLQPADGHALPDVLTRLKGVAIATNRQLASQLGIQASAAITCVKPSGTVSQLVDAASGIHARHAPYFIRTVRGDNKDPLTQYMVDHGIPMEPDVTRPERTSVFSFPMRSPEGALCRADLTAVQQLELWLSYQRHWCEHKPSVTISVKESEWMEVGAWVWKHFDEASGISFLPMSEHTYVQAPYQDCDAATYDDVSAAMPHAFSWQGLQDYELEDNTMPGKEFSCTSGSCEAVDIVSSSSQPSMAPQSVAHRGLVNAVV